jgi:hypothetical protein
VRDARLIVPASVCAVWSGRDRIPESGAILMGLSVWRPRREELPQWMASEARAEIEAALCEHFEALHALMEQLGHRPFGRLELRLPGNAFDAQVIYRWERPR